MDSSVKVDCHANFQSARNDKKEVDCHDSATAESRNDNAFSPSLRGSEATEAKQGKPQLL